MKNWKTTLVGALLALFIALEPIVTTGEVNWIQVIIAGGIAVLGYLAKDFDVSGL